jgi:hypothetical protein
MPGMSRRTAWRKRDQKKCCQGHDGRRDGPDGHEDFYITPKLGKRGSIT